MLYAGSYAFCMQLQPKVVSDMEEQSEGLTNGKVYVIHNTCFSKKGRR